MLFRDSLGDSTVPTLGKKNWFCRAGAEYIADLISLMNDSHLWSRPLEIFVSSRPQANAFSSSYYAFQPIEPAARFPFLHHLEAI
jgi:hypothetical protein